MPSLAVKWFDIETGKVQVAELNAPKITVEENPQYANAVDTPALSPALADNAASSNALATNTEPEIKPKSDTISTPSGLSKSTAASNGEIKTVYDKENSILFFVAGLVSGVLLCLVLWLILKGRKDPKKPLPDLYPEK